MKKYPLVGKGLAVGIILLFIGIACSPVINANKVDELFKVKQNPEDKLVQVNCYEFKSDGSIEKTTILLPKSEHLKMTQALSLTTSIEERLEVYKKYGVLPSNVSIQKIKENYDQYLNAKKINVPAIQEYAENYKNIRPLGIWMNTHCKISASIGLGININFGMSAITQWWNVIAALIYQWRYMYIWLFLPGIDLSAFSFCVGAFIETWDGIFPDSSWDLDFCTMILLGFVGYYVEVIPLPIVLIFGEYLGYTVSVLVTGALV